MFSCISINVDTFLYCPEIFIVCCCSLSPWEAGTVMELECQRFIWCKACEEEGRGAGGGTACLRLQCRSDTWKRRGGRKSSACSSEEVVACPVGSSSAEIPHQEAPRWVEVARSVLSCWLRSTWEEGGGSSGCCGLSGKFCLKRGLSGMPWWLACFYVAPSHRVINMSSGISYIKY